MQVARWQSVLVWLWVAFGIVTGASGQALPRIEVRIERIETAKYPDIDVYFRVLDTNPTTAFKPLVTTDVRLFDGPVDGALAPATIISDNFNKPALRPLATGVSLDKSGSVDDVIGFILNAIEDYAALMKNAAANDYRPTDPNRGLPDMTWAMAFSGDANLNLQTTIPYTADIGAIQAWARTNIRAGGFSPIWAALDAAVTATTVQPYDLPDASRIVFLISDGINNRGYPEAPNDLNPARALRNALGARIRCYALAMSFVNDRGVVTGDINRPMMQQVAADTGGVYFEPRSPFPVVPAAPEPPGGNLDAPAGEAVARQFLEIGLGTTANFARTQAKTGPLPGDLQPVVTRVLTPTTGTTGTAAPTSYEQLIVRFPAAGPPPQLFNLNQVTYRELAAVQASMVELARLEVDVTDLQRKDYYRNQVANIMTKINASEKVIYRVTHRIQDEKYDGAVRRVRLDVQYNSSVNGVVTPLQAGTATANYRAPQLMTEDKDEAAPFPLDLSLPHVQLTFDPTRNPRGGPWSGPLELKMVTRLVTEVPSRDGTPPTQVTVARIGQDGVYTPVDPPANLPNLDAVNRHIAGERIDYEALLRSLQATGDFDTGSGVLTLNLKPKTPTAVRNQTDPLRRPVANNTEPEAPRLLHYEVDFTAERPYQYQTNIIGTANLQTINTASRFSLPTMVFYVGDDSPPTLGIYLTPSGRSTTMVAVRPNPDRVDRPPAQYKAALLGDDIGVAVAPPKTLVEGFTNPPFEFDGGGSTPGFVVNERIEIRVQVFAKDNYDRNRNHTYLLNPTPPLPDTDEWTLETRDKTEAKNQGPPYLGRVPFEEAGRLRPSDGNATSGFAFRFEEAGQNDDNQADRKIFRAANVELTGPDSFRILAGQEIFLIVKASDASGNKSEVRIPVLVTPVGVNVDRLRAERERGR